jgi:NAD(P)-dependent dehydrogenase (short-subunit alcohol dehydrogenase family)
LTDTVVVTGASRGLGRYCATQLHEAGYRVVGMGRSEAPDAPFEMRQADVSDPESVARATKDLRRDTSLHALVNAAGIASMTESSRRTCSARSSAARRSLPL